MAKTETEAEREKRWQAESDVYTLKNYGEIAKDEERLKMAVEYLKKQKEDIDLAISSFDD